MREKNKKPTNDTFLRDVEARWEVIMHANNQWTNNNTVIAVCRLNKNFLAFTCVDGPGRVPRLYLGLLMLGAPVSAAHESEGLAEGPRGKPHS